MEEGRVRIVISIQLEGKYIQNNIKNKEDFK